MTPATFTSAYAVRLNVHCELMPTTRSLEPVEAIPIWRTLVHRSSTYATDGVQTRVHRVTHASGARDTPGADQVAVSVTVIGPSAGADQDVDRTARCVGDQAAQRENGGSNPRDVRGIVRVAHSPG